MVFRFTKAKSLYMVFASLSYSILPFNTEVTAWVDKTQWRNFPFLPNGTIITKVRVEHLLSDISLVYDDSHSAFRFDVELSKRGSQADVQGKTEIAHVYNLINQQSLKQPAEWTEFENIRKNSSQSKLYAHFLNRFLVRLMNEYLAIYDPDLRKNVIHE